ncbi:MAG: hypothetical protein QXS37_05240, partial [Candidatus Aenigmatarchaeota archaeon]
TFFLNFIVKYLLYEVYIKNMRTRKVVLVSLPAKFLEKAKKYAKKNNLSFSFMVYLSLKRLMKDGKRDTNIV